MRPASPDEVQAWDQLVSANPDGGNPLQGRAFAMTKAAFGWQPHYLIANNLAILALRRPTLVGAVIYLPAGPGLVTASAAVTVISQLAGGVSATLIKIEPPIEDDANSQRLLRQAGLIKAADVQLNRTTVMVDLAPKAEDMLAGFKQKTRYNIRLAQRNNVTVVPVAASSDNINTMYGLMKATKERAGFYLRPKAYFAHFWQTHAQEGSGQLFFASHNQRVIAGAFVSFVGQTALYKDGGSLRDGNNVQAPYLLQWEIMRWLKDHGCSRYDLHGVPPAGAGPDHRLASLVQFKSGFGPTIQTVGAWDLPLNPVGYRLWRPMGERLTLGFWRRLKQDLFY